MSSDTHYYWQVLKAQSGDRGALEALLEAAAPRLRRYCRRLGVPMDSTDDLLQTILLQLCHKLAWLRDPCCFWPWLYRIAYREAIRFLQRERRWRAWQTEELSLDELPDTTLPLAHDDSALDEAVLALPPASRAVIVLHYREELPLETVAEVLDIPLGTVKSRLAYGLKCLRERLT